MQLARESGDPTHFDRAERAHDRMERLIDGLLTLAT
ncbi:sensor histidine kinase, partial [Halapricum sp. CBA1109]|nr:sensor histidine kinase [Halapricum sp. CBA1109]